ncbi:MAG: hypothetical protein HND44_12030 [Chloroflexi bacterium]|nr:hypothetical protein [Ardenticatenaceae bacterium]MBL1129212.1 hypothetical protein [Chloroflexota bacterium]NOG35287.1 hypothetical protein [Chloroflexota bacterium]GIK58600.1 MAG: hypothetical protein BroJett015_42630 [Chloroflexota bacterium]
MTSERIMTLHPEGKQGVNIEREKYEMMRRAIIGALQASQPQTFSGLEKAVSAQLEGNFDGSISWYFTTVKLDLEARQVVERVPGTRSQQIRLA